jgi:putative membrane protein
MEQLTGLPEKQAPAPRCEGNPFRENNMSNYTDRAANERTFLAWLRTGIAVVAFGFVLEKFNLFVSALKSSDSEIAKFVRIDRLSGPLGRYEGFALMVTGVVLIVIGYLRFLHDARTIGDPRAANVRLNAELIVTVVLVLLVSAYCAAILLH